MAWITLTERRGTTRTFQTVHIVSYGPAWDTGGGSQVHTVNPINGNHCYVTEMPEEVQKRIRQAEQWEYERWLEVRRA